MSTKTKLTPELKIALEQYKKRCKENKHNEGYDNSRAYAGSPMRYFCRFCCEPTETLPENHISRPKIICDPCKKLNDLGLI